MALAVSSHFATLELPLFRADPEESIRVIVDGAPIVDCGIALVAAEGAFDESMGPCAA